MRFFQDSSLLCVQWSYFLVYLLCPHSYIASPKNIGSWFQTNHHLLHSQCLFPPSSVELEMLELMTNWKWRVQENTLILVVWDKEKENNINWRSWFVRLTPVIKKKAFFNNWFSIALTSTQPQIFLSYVSMLLFNMAFADSQCHSEISISVYTSTSH